MLPEIEKKITEGTVTIDDFNQLIAEAIPASTAERMHRRTRSAVDDSHIDPEGHQQLAPVANPVSRVAPKRRKNPDSQMLHRGKIGHAASTRTQRRRARAAVEFIEKNKNQPLTDELVNNIDRRFVRAVALRLLPESECRDWLHQLLKKLNG